jgi:hypothetical protein
MLSVKIYRNWRRNFCYGIYFNKFHAICKGKFQKCDHIYLAIHSHSALIFRLRCISIAQKKNPTFTWRTSTHDDCADFFLPFSKVQFVFIIFMVFINTGAATSFLTSLYWLLSPARNYLICNPCPPWGGGMGVVLLHHYIHAYKIICFINT